MSYDLAHILPEALCFWKQWRQNAQAVVMALRTKFVSMYGFTFAHVERERESHGQDSGPQVRVGGFMKVRVRDSLNLNTQSENATKEIRFTALHDCSDS